MAYATTADVQALINQLGGIAALTLGEASTPTLDQTEAWLDQFSAEIDSLLTGAGYSTVPATGTNDALMIKRYVAPKVAAVVFHAGFMFDETPAKVRTWETEFQAFLDRIIARTQRLIDQAPRSTLRVIYAARYVED